MSSKIEEDIWDHSKIRGKGKVITSRNMLKWSKVKLILNYQWLTIITKSMLLKTNFTIFIITIAQSIPRVFTGVARGSNNLKIIMEDRINGRMAVVCWKFSMWHFKEKYLWMQALATTIQLSNMRKTRRESTTHPIRTLNNSKTILEEITSSQIT